MKPLEAARSASPLTRLRVYCIRLSALFALFASQPNPGLAAEDYGKVFFGVPLDASPAAAEKALAGNKGFTVRASKGERGATINAQFSGGDMTVRYSGDDISFIYYQQGLLPIGALRRVDDYFTKRLGRPAFIKLDDPKAYFPDAVVSGCTAQCADRCPRTDSLFMCDAGRACNAACRGGRVPEGEKALQDFLFDGTARSGRSHASYWSCGESGTAESGNIFAGAPEDCILRVEIDACRRAEFDGKPDTYCRYGTLYRNLDLERRFDAAQVAAAEPPPPVAQAPEAVAPPIVRPAAQPPGAGRQVNPDSEAARLVDRIKDLTERIERDPQDPNFRILRAEEYLQAGQSNAAMGDLRQAMALGAPRERISGLLARARQASSETASTAGATAAPAVSGAEPDVPGKVATRRAVSGPAREAILQKEIAQFDAALAADPDDLEALRGRVEVLTKYGENERALRDLDHYARLTDDHWLTAYRAHVKAELSSPSDAPAASPAADGDRPQPVAITIAHKILGLPITADLPAVERFMREHAARETRRETDERGGVFLSFDDGGASWRFSFADTAALIDASYESVPVDRSKMDDVYRLLVGQYGYPNHIDSIFGEDRSVAAGGAGPGKAFTDRVQACTEKCREEQGVRGSDGVLRLYSGFYLCKDECTYRIPGDAEGLLAWLANDHADLPPAFRLFERHGDHPPLFWSCDKPPTGNAFREGRPNDCYVEAGVYPDSGGNTFRMRIAFRNESLQEAHEQDLGHRQEAAEVAARQAREREREARLAAFAADMGERYPLLGSDRHEELLNLRRNLDGMLMAMDEAMSQPRWLALPEAERELAFVREYDRSNSARQALNDYRKLKRLERDYAFLNTRALIDKMAAEPPWSNHSEPRAAVLAHLDEAEPETMAQYRAELAQRKFCYYEGDVWSEEEVNGAIAKVRRTRDGCGSYTTAGSVAGYGFKTPDFTP
jgi:tetratricopeptide (TPR) repeat protein